MTDALNEKYGTDAQRVQLAFGTDEAQVLDDLSQDTVIAVRVEAAGNENAWATTLARLAQDAEASVRAQVAGNFNTDADTIKLLLQDSSPTVREEASYSEHAENI